MHANTHKCQDLQVDMHTTLSQVHCKCIASPSQVTCKWVCQLCLKSKGFKFDSAWQSVGQAISCDLSYPIPSFHFVICCVFTKSSFWLHSYFNVLCTSNLFQTQFRTCLLSYYHSSCIYPFTYLSICSPFFLSTPFCYLSTTSCFTLWSFFVPWYLFIILCLHMWISLGCDFLCALLHPSLNISCDISCVWFYSYLRRYDYSMSSTPYIISYSSVLVL